MSTINKFIGFLSKILIVILFIGFIIIAYEYKQGNINKLFFPNNKETLKYSSDYIDCSAFKNFKRYTNNKIIETVLNEMDIIYNSWEQDSAINNTEKNILFFGFSGTGKTYAAKIIAYEFEQKLKKNNKEAKVGFLEISMSKIVDKYSGNSEKNLKKLFVNEEYKNFDCVILLIDEINFLLHLKNEIIDDNSSRLKDEFLYLLDGSTDVYNTKYFLIGTTNLLLKDIQENSLRRFNIKKEFNLLLNFPDFIYALNEILKDYDFTEIKDAEQQKFLFNLFIEKGYYILDLINAVKKYKLQKKSTQLVINDLASFFE